MSGPLLSVVVPTRNEAANLELLIGRLDQALAGLAAEVCIVDDSDDESAAILERLAAERPGRLRVVLRHGPERLGGLSTAVVAGLGMAHGDYVAVMDADLQHPPETLPAMLAAARAGADLVVASRYAPQGSAGGLDGGVRRVVSRAATWLARVLFAEARRSSDPLSGFFLCRRPLVDGIEFRPVGFKILLELLVLLPDLRVTDVPLRFAPRAHGSSKAGLGQGLLYLRHIRSLFLDVQGSARFWKFALVGASGLAVFLPVLATLAGRAGLHPLLAFLPAFAVSLAWNTLLNRVWTFADQRRRRGGAGPARYLRWAILAGLLAFAAYAVLIGLGARTVVAGLVAAGVAAVVNDTANRAALRHPPAEGWARVAADSGVQAALARLAAQVGAGRAYLLPARLRGADPTVPAELLARVVERRRAALWTEAPSYRPQRRTNIESISSLLVPVVWDDAVVAVVVCERRAPRGFDAGALDTATLAVSSIAVAIAQAGGETRAIPLTVGEPG